MKQVTGQPKCSLVLRGIVVFSLVTTITCYSHFRDRLPNGQRVTHPCKANYMWYGVGHENPQGGGARNSFGQDFETFGFTWNECLCKTDSDGDGRTNGEELGDPDCVWKPGQDPQNIKGITHPGVCEPYDSVKCRAMNSFLDCESGVGFECDAINSPDVRNITLHLNDTAVPSSDTTYICQAFHAPNDDDYHVIGGIPYLVNRNVMHHIAVYGCSAPEGSTAWERFGTPDKCGMPVCSTLIGLWSLGSNGICLDDQMGFNVGRNGFQTIVVELHWNNPEMRSDYRDSSGMTLYYTRNKRPNDAGVLMAAPAMVQIPPGHLSYTNYGGCSSGCTNKMIGEGSSINLTYFLPHMHYLGNSFYVEHIRNGEVVNTINVPQYFYDSPQVTYFKEPIEVFGGDELKVTCIFQSKSINRFTYFGEATSDEMCIAIFMYYPYKPSVGFCRITDGFGSCENEESGDMTPYCNKSDFHALVNTHYQTLFDICDVTGLECKSGCEQALQPIKLHPCLNGPTETAVKADYHWTKDTQQFLNMLASCDTKQVHTIDDANDLVGSCDLVSKATLVVNDIISSVIIAILLIMIYI